MDKSDIESARRAHFRGDGVHHATINNHRFHLRLSKGTHHHLWIDGRQPPLTLDQTAADFLTHIIDAMWLFQRGEGDESEQVIDYVISAMYQKYSRKNKKVTREVLRADLDQLYGKLMNLANGQCPVELGLEQKSIHYDKWSAPARMDLAVTYRCNLKCGKCYLPDCSQGSELSFEDWLRVYEILWKQGIPQLVFTGGEPTLREDIVRLITEADEFATGLVTNGTRLVELSEPLLEASLDYVQVTIESSDPDVHDTMTETSGSHTQTVAGIRKAIKTGLQVVTNTTLSNLNGPHFTETVKWLHSELGVSHIACNTLICSGKGTSYRQEHGMSDEELKPVLDEVCNISRELDIDFQWYSPTCYNIGINPMEMGLGIKCCSAAAHNMTVQPDGTVLPCQSWPEPVGNILTDKWDTIWRNKTCVNLRNRKLASAKCNSCGHFETCGGGCPLDDSPRQNVGGA